jgi:CubicO group peptidase (beta-lactamase class C family)
MADGTPRAASPYYTVPASRDIAIIDLLTHGSGLASGGITDADYQKIMKARTPTDTLADFIPRLGALPLDFEPGTAWRYSPLAAFDTLGRIVEIVSGMSFDRFLRERLFGPLDMPDTGFNVPEKDAARKVTIYRRTETGLEKLANSPVFTGSAYFSGAGGLISTAEDYYKFAQMLCNGGILNGKRILSPWTVDLMLSEPGRRSVQRTKRPRPERRRFRTGRRGRGERRRCAPAQAERELRLGRGLRHLLVGEPERADGGRVLHSDRQPFDTVRLRQRRFPGGDRVNSFSAAIALFPIGRLTVTELSNKFGGLKQLPLTCKLGPLAVSFAGARMVHVQSGERSRVPSSPTCRVRRRLWAGPGARDGRVGATVSFRAAANRSTYLYDSLCSTGVSCEESARLEPPSRHVLMELLDQSRVALEHRLCFGIP